MSITKIPRRYCRTLRTFRRVAQKEHGHCPMCQRLIMPGEEYEAYVTISPDFGFRVTKWHVICPPEFWDEEEEAVKQADEQASKEEAANELSAAA